MTQQKQRWMDSLPNHDTDGCTPNVYRHSALQWLSDALYWTEVGDQPKLVANALARAGGTVVAWRKSLDDQGVKQGDILVADEPQAMWIASCIRAISYGTNQHDLRWVEAVLRSIWREGQQR